MNDPLAHLKGLHIDPWVWWPPALGWYALLVLIVITIFLIQRYFKNRHLKRLPNKQALDTLENILSTYKKDKNATGYLQAINTLLRQVAIQKYGRAAISALAGQPWIDFLNRGNRTKTTLFSVEDAKALIHSAYQKDPQVNVASIDTSVKKWIQQQLNNSTSKKNTAAIASKSKTAKTQPSSDTKKSHKKILATLGTAQKSSGNAP